MLAHPAILHETYIILSGNQGITRKHGNLLV